VRTSSVLRAEPLKCAASWVYRFPRGLTQSGDTLQPAAFARSSPGSGPGGRGARLAGATLAHVGIQFNEAAFHTKKSDYW